MAFICIYAFMPTIFLIIYISLSHSSLFPFVHSCESYSSLYILLSHCSSHLSHTFLHNCYSLSPKLLNIWSHITLSIAILIQSDCKPHCCRGKKKQVKSGESREVTAAMMNTAGSALNYGHGQERVDSCWDDPQVKAAAAASIQVLSLA